MAKKTESMGERAERLLLLQQEAEQLFDKAAEVLIAAASEVREIHTETGEKFVADGRVYSIEYSAFGHGIGGNSYKLNRDPMKVF